MRLNNLEIKITNVRYELNSIMASFTNGFDLAVTAAYKTSDDRTSLSQLKDLAGRIIAQQKSIRDATMLVGENMTLIYQSVDSAIDELDREVNALNPNPNRIRQLIRVIYDTKDTTENLVRNAVQTSLNALGCNGPALASRLSSN